MPWAGLQPATRARHVQLDRFELELSVVTRSSLGTLEVYAIPTAMRETTGQPLHAPLPQKVQRGWSFGCRCRPVSKQTHAHVRQAKVGHA
jgi:hypothetical protein